MKDHVASRCAPFVRLIFVAASLVVSPQGTAVEATLSGSATYRERMALPPDAVFEATLEDVSRADVAAEVITRTRIAAPGNPPFRFTLNYDTARIIATHHYVVRARILVREQLYFTTDMSYPVLKAGQPDRLELLLRRVSATAPAAAIQIAGITGLPASFAGDLPCADCTALRYHLDLLASGSFFLRKTYVGKSNQGIDETGRWFSAPGSGVLQLEGTGATVERFQIVNDTTLRKLDQAGRPIQSTLNYALTRQETYAPVAAPRSTATLENTYWKLTRLSDQPVGVGQGQREPHLILRPGQKSVGGSGGCNNLVGSYALAGEQLTFGRMAGTLMACPQGMEQERAFHEALSIVTRWRILGETLDLFNASGESVAQFESRYLR